MPKRIKVEDPTERTGKKKDTVLVMQKPIGLCTFNGSENSRRGNEVLQ